MPQTVRKSYTGGDRYTVVAEFSAPRGRYVALHHAEPRRNAKMTHLTKPICLLALSFGRLTSLAREYEGSRENSILLNGPLSASYRHGVGAVDVAGNDAKSSEITVGTR
jgi:hypothetical protein